MSRVGGVLALVLLLALVSTQALGLTTGEQAVADVIATRLAAMNQIAADAAAAAAAIEAAGDGPLSASTRAPAASLVAALDGLGGMFPPESNLLGGAVLIDGVSTTAALAIWEDFEAYSKTLDKALQAATAMQQAVDVGAYAAALADLQRTCTGCHETYVVYDPFAALQ